jgi:hypothetical protein
MNSRHRKTLEAVFRDPVSGSIAWNDLEALPVARGGTIVEGSGSRLRFEKDKIIGYFHRPHPAKDAKKYQVRDAREFLVKIGITP